MFKTAKDIGDDKEALARHYLESQGMNLLTRNYRCRSGEIDLVMRDGEQMVFVEVRYRKSGRFGSAAETVSASKRRRIVAAAAHYLQRHRVDRPCRFDVLAITGTELEWLKDAFRLDAYT